MRLLFATDRLHVPDDFSGSVQSTHAMMRGLAARSHDCQIVASLPHDWRHFTATAFYRLTARRTVLEWTDRGNGYLARRGSAWRFVERTRRAADSFAPDALVLDSTRMLRALHAEGFQPKCPIVLVMHDLDFAKQSANLPFAERTWIVGNSPYTASRIAQHIGVAPAMVPPVIHLQDYVVERRDARHVTLISPHRRKGLELVLEVARQLPHMQFQLVEGWPMSDAQLRELALRIRPLGNVSLQRSTEDMREIYATTKVLLAPSEMETFGRVVVEAQASGIPVMVRDAGALRWVAGSGGLVFAPDAEPAAWANQLARLFEDSHRYAELSEKARTNAMRPDFQAEHVVARFEALLNEAVADAAAHEDGNRFNSLPAQPFRRTALE